jgi:hypothetical protein
MGFFDKVLGSDQKEKEQKKVIEITQQSGDFAVGNWPDLPDQYRTSAEAMKNAVSVINRNAAVAARSWDRNQLIPDSYISVLKTLIDPDVAARMLVATGMMMRKSQSTRQRTDAFYEHPKNAKIVVGLSTVLGDPNSLRASFKSGNFGDNEFTAWSEQAFHHGYQYYVHCINCLDEVQKNVWYLFAVRGNSETTPALSPELRAMAKPEQKARKGNEIVVHIASTDLASKQIGMLQTPIREATTKTKDSGKFSQLIALEFDDFAGDSRPPHKIPEIAAWIMHLNTKCPYLPYWLDNEGIRTFIGVLSDDGGDDSDDHMMTLLDVYEAGNGACFNLFPNDDELLNKIIDLATKRINDALAE